MDQWSWFGTFGLGSICSLATWWLSSCKVAKNKQPVVSKFLFTLWLLFVGRGLVLLHFLTRRRRKQTQTPDFLQEMHFCFFYKLLESAFKSSIEWLPLSKHIICTYTYRVFSLKIWPCWDLTDKLAGMIYFEVGLLQHIGWIESQESHRMDKEDETSVLKELAHISHCTSWKDFSRAPILRFMQTSRFPIKFE